MHANRSVTKSASPPTRAARLCSPTQAFNFAFKDTIKETFPKYNSSVGFLREPRFRKQNSPQFINSTAAAACTCSVLNACWHVVPPRTLLLLCLSSPFSAETFSTLGPADRLLEILCGEHGVRRRRGRRLPAVRVPAGLCADAPRR